MVTIHLRGFHIKTWLKLPDGEWLLIVRVFLLSMGELLLRTVLFSVWLGIEIS